MKFRFAFSTTDVPHVENLREALFAWGLSRHVGGDFVLLVTDNKERWQPMVDALAWLGLDWDDGPDKTAESWWGDGEDEDEDDAEAITAVSPLINSGLATLATDNTLTLSLPPLTLPDGAPLSQRGFRFTDLQDAGYLPKALFNYLLLLGWIREGESQIVDKWRVRQEFAPERLSMETAVFDWVALREINRHYIQQLGGEALAEEIRPFLEDAYGMLPSTPAWLTQLALLIQPEISTLEESIEAAEFALSDEFDVGGREITAVLSAPEARLVLTHLVAEVAHVVLLDTHTAQTILNGLTTRLQKEDLQPDYIAQPIRAALSGQTSGPPLAQMMGIIGKQRTLMRAAHALRNH